MENGFHLFHDCSFVHNVFSCLHDLGGWPPIPILNNNVSLSDNIARLIEEFNHNDICKIFIIS